MKRFLSLLCLLITGFAYPLQAVSDTFVDYQNFNHGYCPSCNCYPCRCNEMIEEIAPEEEYEDCDECAEECDAPCEEPCETPDPCDPCSPAPVCGTTCGVCLLTVGVVIVSLAVAGVIFVSTNGGSSH